MHSNLYTQCPLFPHTCSASSCSRLPCLDFSFCSIRQQIELFPSFLRILKFLLLPGMLEAQLRRCVTNKKLDTQQENVAFARRLTRRNDHEWDAMGGRPPSWSPSCTFQSNFSSISDFREERIQYLRDFLSIRAFVWLDLFSGHLEPKLRF